MQYDHIPAGFCRAVGNESIAAIDIALKASAIQYKPVPPDCGIAAHRLRLGLCIDCADSIAAIEFLYNLNIIQNKFIAKSTCCTLIICICPAAIDCGQCSAIYLKAVG